MPDDERPFDDESVDNGDGCEPKPNENAGPVGSDLGESVTTNSILLEASDAPFVAVGDDGITLYNKHFTFDGDGDIRSVIEALRANVVADDSGDDPEGTLLDIGSFADVVKSGWSYKNIRPHIRSLEQAGVVEKTEAIGNAKREPLRVHADMVRFHSFEEFRIADGDRIEDVLRYLGSRKELEEADGVTFDRDVPSREAWLYGRLRDYTVRSDDEIAPEVWFQFRQYGKPDDEFEHWDEFPYDPLFDAFGNKYDEFVVFIDIEYRNLEIWNELALTETLENAVVQCIAESMLDEFSDVSSAEILDAAEKSVLSTASTQEADGDYQFPNLEYDVLIDESKNLIRLAGLFQR